MTTTLLTPTETKTAEKNVIRNTVAGFYRIWCTGYASPIQIQVRPDGGEWHDAVFAGELIKLTEKYSSFFFPLSPFCSYRVRTETAGAEVLADPAPNHLPDFYPNRR